MAEDKIIHTFQQRRQLSQAFEQLAETETEEQLLDAVRYLVDRYPADLLATTLIKHLDTPSSQLRGGLGHIAALLPPDVVSPVLRSTVASRQNSAQVRLTAALLIERFLGEAIPPALVADLQQSNDVAMQSLQEAITEAQHNRHILLEYVSQMRQHDINIAFMVLDLIERLPASDRVEMLRLIAQDDRLPVAKEALARLEELANNPTVGQNVLRALHTLRLHLPASLAESVQRILRKLQFSGKRYQPPASDGWRALLSPSDAAGNQAIWFVYLESPTTATGVIIGVVINSEHGLLQAFGGDRMAREHLPPAHAIGTLVPVKTDQGDSAILLEAPFDFARWRLEAALTAHWQLEEPRPLPAEYRLYHDLIWQFDQPVASPELAAYFEPPAPDAPLPDVNTLDEAALGLMAHPAMDEWIVQNRLLARTIQISDSDLAEKDVLELAALILLELDQRPERVPLLQGLAQGLSAQAAWLHIGRHLTAAASALLLAHASLRVPPSHNPLLGRMIAASLKPLVQQRDRS
jgi:hypothetical protein